MRVDVYVLVHGGVLGYVNVCVCLRVFVYLRKRDRERENSVRRKKKVN